MDERFQKYEGGTEASRRPPGPKGSDSAHKGSVATDQRIRILYSHRVHSRDGQSVHVDELVAAFRADNHQVLVIGPSFYDSARFGEESPAVAKIRRFLPTIFKEIAEILLNLLSFYRLYRAYRSFGPDVIYERYNLFLFAGSWLARWTGLPFYLEVNAPLATERDQFGTLRLKALAHFAERIIWRSATRLFVVTKFLRDIVAANGVDLGRIHVIKNGVVSERFSEHINRFPQDSITLGFVGFLRTWHGMDAVVEAMSRYSGSLPIRLIIVGDGPARPALEAQVKTLGLSESVDFMGVVPSAEIPDLLRRFDIALQPKAVPYASPLKIFDYMAAGLAIVAPDQPNIREILQHNVNALLFDPDDNTAMWRAISQLIKHPELIRQIGLAARSELVSENYTWRGNAARIAAWVAQDKKGS